MFAFLIGVSKLDRIISIFVGQKYARKRRVFSLEGYTNIERGDKRCSGRLWCYTRYKTWEV